MITLFDNIVMSGYRDLESSENPEEYVQGFHDFAEFIASDVKLSIYRRYDSLAARNLLYLEGELQLLECELREIDEEELRILKTGNDNEKKETDEAARNLEDLLGQANRGEVRASRKVHLLRRLRTLIKDYEKAALRRNQILALGRPEGESFTAFKNWFRSRVPFRKSGWHLLQNENDMFSVYLEPESDRLSSLIHRYFGYYVRKHKDFPRSWGENKLYYYPTDRIVWIVAIISVFMSAFLLMGAIVALYLVKNMAKRLGILAIFTSVFAGSIGLLTNARRAEIFGSTAAYAAVLVVFVSVTC